MVWKILRFIFTLPLLGAIAVIASSCTQLGLNYASLETANKPVASPALEVVSLADWRTREAPALKQALEAAVFGPVPTGIPSRVLSKRIVDERYLGGRGVLEEYVIELGEAGSEVRFHLALATPRAFEGPRPIIIGQTFCDNMGVFEHAGLSVPWRARACGLTETQTALGSVFMFIFGEYIAKAPMEDYLERGWAYANFYASEIVPDAANAGRAALDVFPVGADGRRATGAVAAWAAGYFAALDLVEADPRIDPSQMAVFGHSRHGKSALVAAAWDTRIAAVVSHQSGTGGASLSRRKQGETVRQITDNYPHWFDPAYASFGANPDTLPVDQHALIALIAPRRVLLGNGRRDVWSDPNGAYRASLGASPAWVAHGRTGLDQDGLRDWNANGDIAFHLRRGGHGIVRADIDAFVSFLEASFVAASVQTDQAP